MTNPTLHAVEKLTPEHRTRYDGMAEVYDMLGSLFREYEAHRPDTPVSDAFPAVLEFIRGHLHDEALKMLQAQLDTAGKDGGEHA